MAKRVCGGGADEHSKLSGELGSERDTRRAFVNKEVAKLWRRGRGAPGAAAARWVDGEGAESKAMGQAPWAAVALVAIVFALLFWHWRRVPLPADVGDVQA